MRFTDRADAGRQLVEPVATLALPDPVVLALPRGGVPLAAVVARALAAPLDVFVVRKIGAPGRPELGVGAVAEGLADPVVSDVAAQLGLTADDVGRLAGAEREEIARRVAAYRDGRPLPPIAGRDVVLVDDGLATGVTAHAALLALRALGPRSLRLAVPVCAGRSADRLRTVCDGVIAVVVSDDMRSVGECYDDFTQTTDAEVRRLLAAPGQPGGPRSPGR